MGTDKHSVVIVGGGVGGVRAALMLSKNSHYSVTLISKNKTFDHRTSLFRNKRGRSLRHISIPLQSVFRSRRHDIDLVRAEVSRLDAKKQSVSTVNGIEYPYQSLIVALEGESRVPEGVPESDVHNAYSASDMSELRKQLILDAERGKLEGNYAVIGAGETGVEIVGELKRLLDSLSRRYMDGKVDCRVALIEQGSRIVPKSSREVSRKILKRLTKKGIRVLSGSPVAKLEAGVVHLENKKLLEANKVIVAAGRRANHFFADNKDSFLLNQDGFVRTNSLLEAEGYNNIYVIGNSKDYEHDLNTSGKLYDAQYIVELMEAKREGSEIAEYSPPPYNAHIQIGKTWAVYEGDEHTLTGRLGWIRKRWLDLIHFSTLLPTRLWFVVWMRGTRHDEIH